MKRLPLSSTSHLLFRTFHRNGRIRSFQNAPKNKRRSLESAWKRFLERETIPVAMCRTVSIDSSPASRVLQDSGRASMAVSGTKIQNSDLAIKRERCLCSRLSVTSTCLRTYVLYRGSDAVCVPRVYRYRHYSLLVSP